jgi:hypothetical protein
MKSRTTLVLILVALVFGGFVLLDYHKGTSTEQGKIQRKRVLDFQAQDVTQLKIELTNQVVVLEKSVDKWQIKQPLNVPASSSAINSILDELEFIERDRTLTEKELKGVTLAGFGLEKPRLRVTLQLKKSPLELLIGNETPTKEALYVQVRGKKGVLVVPKSIYKRLNLTLNDLRDRIVVDFLPATATRLEIKSADRVIELAKTIATITTVETRWTLTQPLTARADSRKVSELLADLNNLRVRDFVSEDPKDIHSYQLDEPEREIVVWTGQSNQTLLLGRSLTNDADRVFAKLKNADSIFTVNASMAKKFAVQANDLRDARVFAFSENDVRGIQLTRGSEAISLVRTDSTWELTKPTVVAAEDSAAQQLLGLIKDLSAKQFTADVATDLDKYGLATPTATVSLQGAGTNVLVQLLVGTLDTSNAVRFVKRTDEPFVYGVDTNMDGWLPTNTIALRSRRLAGFKTEQISKLTIERKSGKIVIERRGADKKWHLVEPSQGVLDDDALQWVLDGLAQLQAEEFIREDHDHLADYGLDQPEVTITAAVGEKNYTLAIGQQQGADRKYALWSDPALIFTIRVDRANTLTKNLVTLPAPANVPAEPLPAAPAATPLTPATP